MLSKPLRVIVTALLLVALAACGEDRPERAATIDSSEGEADQGDGDGVEAPADSAGEQLSADQVEAALLTADDLPSGWTQQESEEDDSEDTIDPPRCQEVVDSLREARGEPAADGRANFLTGGPYGTLLTVSLSTYDEDVDENRTQEMADAFTECQEFTSTDEAGQTDDVTLSAISLPNLGDQTLAVAIEFANPEISIVLNYAYIVVGHNVLTVGLGGIEGSEVSELEELAGLAVDKLGSTTS